MELTKRLERVASFVSPGSVLADVGTDHGYIPIYLAKKGIVKKAYAMDINEGPLLKASKNIKAHGVEVSVETILSDGLMQLGDRKIDTLIVAGMGGMLIKKILEDAQCYLSYITKMILSPHLDVDVVRKAVHQLGFAIEQEDFLEDEGKYYPILVCRKGHESYENAIDYKYGKRLLEDKNQTLKAYLIKQRAANNTILAQLLEADTPASQTRMAVIKFEISELEEVIKCL